MESGKTPCALFIDLSKAFDTLSFDIRSIELLWILDCLLNSCGYWTLNKYYYYYYYYPNTQTPSLWRNGHRLTFANQLFNKQKDLSCI